MLAAVREFNRLQRLQAVAGQLGKSKTFMDQATLRRLREEP